MIQGEVFVQALRQAGFEMFAGTPCSYLTPLLNAVIAARDIQYIGAANEGDAVAIAAGAELAGKPGVTLFQNSGLGNAVNPLTSLTATFKIPILLIVSWRGQLGGPPDEPQHDLMGRITSRLLDTMEIPWGVVSHHGAELAPLLHRAVDHLHTMGTPFALLLPEGTVAPQELRCRPGEPRPSGSGDRHNRSLTVTARPWTTKRLQQDDVLRAIQEAAGADSALLTTTGYTGRALYALADRPNHFYMVGSMGCLSSLGLGLARVRPDKRIVVVDGDGAMLMRLGAVATLGHERPPNLVHVLLDNGVHDSTGGQPTVSASVDWAAVAQACGYPCVIRGESVEDVETVLRQRIPSLTFVDVKTHPRSNRKLPRPTVTPPQVAARFRHWLRTSP